MDTLEAFKFSEAMEEHSKIEANCQRNKTNFVDKTFPADLKSIGELQRKAGDAIPGHIVEFEWKRPNEIKKSGGDHLPWTVFNDPQSSDIEQGSLGDCWLLSAMALIAERPDVLIDIFITKEYSPSGIYQLRICMDGEWKIVTVDDYFPNKKGYNRLAFANGTKNQLWVPLIEKAIAKLLGSYGKLVSGRTSEGLAMLTGAPCEHISLSSEELDKDLLWGTLLSTRDQNFIMGCSCSLKGNLQEEDYISKGLKIRHAYSILEVIQKENNRLLRIRNPWGKSHSWKDWNGDWSDDWAGWDPQLKAELLNEEYRSQTGAFWISFEDFLRYFGDIDVALIRSHSWEEYRFPVQLGKIGNEKERFFWFFIEENTQIYITLFQNGARKEENMADIIFCVHRMESNGSLGEIVAQSKGKCANFVSTKEKLFSHGAYIIICHSFSNLGVKKIPGTVVIHSSKSIFFNKTEGLGSISTTSLIKMTIKYGKKAKQSNGVVVYSLGINRFAGLILVAENREPKDFVHIRVDCSNSQNVLSSRGDLSIADSIPPKTRQILIVLSQFEHSAGFSTNYKLTSITSKNKLLNEGTAHLPELTNEAIRVLHSTRPL